MNKNKYKTLLSVLICCAIFAGNISNGYAVGPEDTVVVEGEEFTEESDYEDGNNLSAQDIVNKESSKEQSTNTSSGQVNNYVYNSDETTAKESKNNIVRFWRDLANGTSAENIYYKDGYMGLVAVGTAKLSRQEAGMISDYVKSLQSVVGKSTSTGKNIGQKYNRNTPAQKTVDTANIDDITKIPGGEKLLKDKLKDKVFPKLPMEMKNDILSKLPEKNSSEGIFGNINGVFGNIFDSVTGSINSAVTPVIGGKPATGSQTGNNSGNGDISHAGIPIQMIPTMIPGIRTDLFPQGLYDTESYLDRYYGILNWYSNAMEDFLEIKVINDYHFSEINLEHRTAEEYVDPDGNPTMKWTLYDSNGNAVKTDVGKATKMKYIGVPAGTYRLKVEQQKKITQSIRAYYDVHQYVVDTSTNTILYYNNISVSGTGSRDNGGYVEIENTTTYEWLTTLEKNITVNSLGEVESGISGTERVQ